MHFHLIRFCHIDGKVVGRVADVPDGCKRMGEMLKGSSSSSKSNSKMAKGGGGVVLERASAMRVRMYNLLTKDRQEGHFIR